MMNKNILKHAQRPQSKAGRLLLPALIGVAFLCGVFTTVPGRAADGKIEEDKVVAEQSAEIAAEKPAFVPLPEGVAGKYLSSHFAQKMNDWDTANLYLNDIIARAPKDAELVRRSMVLAMGAGDIELASSRAGDLLAASGQDESLPLLILAVAGMAAGNHDSVLSHLARMQPGDMTDFVKPIVKGWAAAAQGRFDIEGFNDTSIHRYHAALIAAFLKNDPELERHAQAMIEAGTMSGLDAERSADLLSLLGRFGEAALLYEGVLAQEGRDKNIAAKLAAVKMPDGGNILELAEPLRIVRPQMGAALALYDMAFILYQEHSDNSTKIFAHMALALDPNLTDAHLLLADTQTRNGRFREAIAQLENVPADHPSYLAVRRHAAELLAEVGRYEEALAQLNRLFLDHNDVESLIRAGDLHRQQEDFKGALSAYNRAAQQIGDKIPEEYWYLLYARGMAYEREGDWGRAESDLKAAMLYRPDHPYLLNYLGYGWADQGLHLDKSLELIKRAVELRPMDGYIIDSLGWVHYMMGNYKEAIASLERAVELLPYDGTINDHLGDAYWKVGRRMEAQFQWQRALNYGEDEALAETLRHKLRFGLEGLDNIKQAGAEKAPQ